MKNWFKMILVTTALGGLPGTGCSKKGQPEESASSEPLREPKVSTVAEPAGEPTAPGVKPALEVVSSNSVEALRQPGDAESAAAEPWKTAVEAVLSSGTTDPEKAHEILKMVGELDPKVQEEVTLTAVRLLRDEELGMVKGMVMSPSTPAPVLEGFMVDIYDRGLKTKLAFLLELAQTPGHPLGEEALDALEVHVEGNYGTDWKAWGEAVEATLVREAPPK